MQASLQSDANKGLVAEILRLKSERNAVILAHNYQVPEVQDIADLVGDSLGLSQAAARTPADVIVFCGVHFMAETASIISPQKTVLLPDLGAGCSLAATIDADKLRAWKKEHPKAVVVSYVNTTAEVKAESDYACTSGNAVKVVSSIPRDREILFLPDMFLGAYVMEKTGRKMEVWPGECHVHAGITPDVINRKLAENRDAEFLVHPECGCVTQFLYFSEKGDFDLPLTQVYSTEGMVRHARQSQADKFLVATETGILHRMRKENPGKTFLPVKEDAVCQYMKTITLEKVYRSLRDMVYEVRVPGPIADKARLSIERMLELA
ncbi:quinolinate synthase [archaeon 13_1_40CM_4_53_4]|nr:MAG: quinolinate synthase [archaeon 13_2_20CM_2_53_6]OLC61897.1 MAG: quinolinate synthase [archaeon 13_1_40CM_4_53_4]OLE58498.1 MAG: quinolinate synthase [Crenarchaeota archaeon 13_1_20CM_2_53_14]